jgi:type II secretory pathway pseudopilin PulG
MRTTTIQARSAFTLVEVMVGCAIMAIVGGMAFLVLNTGTLLFAKNTAVNVAHQEARMAMIQMEREFHSAVSPVQLVDEDGNAVSGNGPAAGISFQVFAAGPFQVVAEAKFGQNQVRMALGNHHAKTTQRLVIANHELEIDIAADDAGTGDRTLTLTENIPNTISVEMDDAGTMQPVQVVGMITERVQYIVKDGELRHRDRNGQTTVIARDITSDKPFSRPKKGAANPNSRSIAAVNLSTGKKNGKNKEIQICQHVPKRGSASPRPTLHKAMKTTALNSRAEGNAMLVALMVITLLSVAVVSALNLTSGVSRNVSRTNHYRDAVSVGDGALDYLFAHWQTKARAKANTQLKGDDFSDIPMPTADLFPAVPNFLASRAADDSVAVSNLRIQGLSPTWEPLPDGSEVPPASGMNLGARSYFYLATADVTLRNMMGKPQKVNARRVFEKEIGSPWMYAIFYTDRLEIHPGPEFHVTGWVHTNENLYTAHDTLWFESKVTFANEWLSEFAPKDGAHDPKDAKDPHWNPEMRPRQDDTQDPMGMSVPVFNANDQNKNNDGYRELIEMPVDPKKDANSTLDPKIEDQRYFNQAEVKVLVEGTYESPTIKIYAKGGGPDTAQPSALSPSSVGTDLAIYNTFKNAVTVGDKIQDNRENKEVRLLTIDMAKVNTAMQPGGPLHGKIDGIIYASDTTVSDKNTQTSTGSRGGVRLKNGATIPPGGLTMVSNNPIYIQGDYNTGANGSVQPDSNRSGGDPTKNTVPGYQKQSCAVVGDAVMILSNAWQDANSYKAVDQRNASPTTVNTAIVSGIVPTGEVNNNYSGGAENFPRFMEKWGSGNTFTYYGSMVELYKSQQNVGVWGKGNVYDPPKRKWYFDRQFYTDPPPGTLSLISFKKNRWFQQ